MKGADIMTAYQDFSFKGDSGQSQPMSSYMKNQFPFLGVPAPERRKQSREVIALSKKLPLSEIPDVVEAFYNREEREYQYLAIDICTANARRLTLAEIQLFAGYVGRKSWWDSVDAWRKVFGNYVRYHPEDKAKVFALFHQHPDFWLRRVAILLQLMEKETLDKAVLTDAILFDRETTEFFIQKAIGWALRQYSKYNPDWVAAFIAKYPLSRLAQKEGSKYLL